MASRNLTKADLGIGIAVGALLGLFGSLLPLFPSESVYGNLSTIIYALVVSAVLIAIIFAGKNKFPLGKVWIAALIFGILFPVCIPFTFVAAGKLSEYSLGSSSYTGSTNGGNNASGNFSGSGSGVVPKRGSRFADGGSGAAPEAESFGTEAFGGSSKGGTDAPASGGPRFGRTEAESTEIDIPEHIGGSGLFDRIAEFDDSEPITIELVDGRPFSFYSIAIIPLDGETYCIVECAEDIGEFTKGTLGVFQFIYGPNGEELIKSVEDDDILARVEAEFQRMIAEQGGN